MFSQNSCNDFGTIVAPFRSVEVLDEISENYVTFKETETYLRKREITE